MTDLAFTQTADDKRTIKRAVRSRDGHRCTQCGMDAATHVERYGKGLEVHRLDAGSLYSLEGCVTLCKPCHARTPRRQSGRPRGRRLTGKAIVFACERSWLRELDAAAKALGVGRSGFVRMACVEQMAADRRDLAPPTP